MKHKIFTQVIIIAAMLIAALMMYENSPAIAQAIGASVRAIDTSAITLAMGTIIPAAAINAIRKEEQL